MSNIRERVQKLFQDEFGREPSFVVRAPGRVNLLGEHVDYNDGFVLPAAIDRAVWAACSPSTAPNSTLVAADLSERISFSLDSIQTKTDLDGNPLPHWAKYPAGVLWILSKEGHNLPAIDGIFTSDVPRGSGLSSSAAVEMAFVHSFIKAGDVSPRPSSMDLAKIALRAEREYVGVNCGIMDQFASSCGVQDHALYLDCRSLEWEPIPLPRDVSIVIADTSVPRSLSDSAYNERRSACETAVQLLDVESLRDVAVDLFHKNKTVLPQDVAKRAQHVVEEIQRTEQSVHLLQMGNVKAFGRLMNQCHESLRDLYEVSCPELDVMVEIAQSLPGCYGARLTGAGFGGCTVNLVADDKVEDFSRELAVQYKGRTDKEAKIYVCRADEGAGIVKLT
ncbi:MAG TPA: galactokinase [Anaerolineales bacterium]|nr:galactokinase [Anaerolineales bacterium]